LKSTATRLFSALLGYVTLVILLMTLNPFYVALPEKATLKFNSSLDNLILNIILFLPVGFLYRLITGQRGALLLGAAISISIETVQLFIPARTTSAMDVVTNTLGAGLGGFFHYMISSRINVTPTLVNRLRLETPLMGLSYLLIPLLWINTLAINEAPYRWLLTILIGTWGAIIFSDLFRHWWPSIDWRVIGYAFLASGTWFLIGAGPGLLRSSNLLLIALGVMLLTALLTAVPRMDTDRRFEQNTLRSILPSFALYALLLTLWFPFHPFGAWHGFFGFTDRSTDTSLYALYPRLEYLAAFSVLGYLSAEWRGRLELPLAQDLPRLFLMATSAALLLEILSGFQSEHGASVVRFVLAVCGALFGGIIYHLSRAHIRFLLGR
jgi:glycopeptide antibiotics resistance protein